LSGMDIAKKSVRASLILFVGNFVSAVIGAVTIFLIARLLGPAPYGVYTLALVIPGFLQLFLGFGVGNSIIRYSALSISKGDYAEARRFTINAIYFLWLTGVCFTFLSYILAGLLTSPLLHRSDLTPLVQLASLGIIGSAILQAITFAAIGWSWMTLSSASQISQALIRLVISTLLILVGIGVAGALTGLILSLILSGLVGTLVLYHARLRNGGRRGDFSSDIKKMLGFGLPVYAGSLFIGVASYYVTLVLANIATDTVIGLYQAALNFLVPVSLVANSLVSALFPAFTTIEGIGADAKVAFQQAYKFVAFLLLPAIMFIVSAASLLVRLFYGPSFLGSVPYLQMLSLAYIPIAFGYSVHPAFFNGFGRPRFTLFVYVSSGTTLIASAYTLSELLGYGVYGLIFSIFLSFLVAWLVGTVLADKFMGARLDLRASGAMILATVASFVVTEYLPTSAITRVLALIFDFVLFFGLYLTLAPLAGAINRKDLDIMEHAFQDLGFLERSFRWVLRYERLMISIRKGPSKRKAFS
jgi:stage V sporulation protein B